MSGVIKLSSPATDEFWEVPILFEDDQLLALDKPAGLLVAPDRNKPAKPSLLALVRLRRPGYLLNAHRLDFGASGVLMFAKVKSALISLSEQFSTDEPRRTYVALVHGTAAEETFSTDARLAPHPLQMGVMRVDTRLGKRSRTDFAVRERLKNYILLDCRPVPDRPHQIHAHLKYLRLPLVGAGMYGGRPLLLSSLKTDYRLKRGAKERPLMGHDALHAEKLVVKHPATGEELAITAAWPKDLTVAVKYLHRYDGQQAAS